MTPSFFSFRVHKIVEYLKSTGFDFETDELWDLGIQEILQRFGVYVSLSREEEQLLMQELLILAERNEIREGLNKTKEKLGLDWELLHVTPSRASFCGRKEAPTEGASKG